MTHAVLMVDGETDATEAAISLDDLALGLAELEEHQPEYRKAQNYYNGNIDEFISNVRLRRKLRIAARAFRINFACVPVDAVAERLRIAAITVDNEVANAAIQEYIRDARMNIRSRKAMLEASKMGDAYLITWPVTDDEGNVAGISTWMNSPENCRIIYDEDQPLVKLFGIKRWVRRDGKTRVDLYYRDRIEKVVSKDQGQGSGKKRGFVTDAKNFEKYFDDDDAAWPADNPYDTIPMFHFRNDEDYGKPEHEKFYGVQNVVFKLIVAHMTGVDYQALPQRYKIATAKPNISDASVVDIDDFAVDGAVSDSEDERLDSEPGGLWDLKNTTAVGQFDAAPDTIFTGPMIVYLRFGAQITETPVHKIDPTGQVESGESRRTAEAPFTNKVQDRQDWYEPTWQEHYEFVLKLMGLDGTVTVRWEPVQTTDDIDAWTVAQAKLDAGVPIQQVFLEMGYEAEQIEEWFGDFDPDVEQDAKVLQAIGTALVSLGTAKGLMPDVLTVEVIDALIAAVLDREEPANVDES